MKIFSDLMRSLIEGKFTVTGELEPKKTTRLDELIGAAKTLKRYVVAANVTDCPAGLAYMNSLIPAYIVQKEVGLETVYQITCRDRNRIAITADLLAAGALGIRNILALTGDYPSLGDMPQAKPVFDLDSQQLVHLIRRMVDEGVDLAGNKIEDPPKFHVGVSASLSIRPLEPEIIKLERKARVGAEFVQTQAVFDIEIAKDFLNKTSHIKLPVLIGICPLRSYGMAKWMIEKLPGIVIPEEVLERIKKAEEKGKEALIEENARLFSEFIKELRKTRAAGVHIMAPGFEEVVPEIVKRAGLVSE